MFVSMSMYMFVCVCVHACVHNIVCMCSCVHLCIHMSTYVRIHVYAYTVLCIIVLHSTYYPGVLVCISELTIPSPLKPCWVVHGI